MQAMPDANLHCTVHSNGREFVHATPFRGKPGDIVLHSWSNSTAHLVTCGKIYKKITPDVLQVTQRIARMPSLFASGQHNALVANQNRLESGERLMAFLDDIVVDEFQLPEW